VVVTLGAAGAVMYEGGLEVARATPPPVSAVDATGAGDAFVGAIVVALVEGMAPGAALAFACAAGALAATRAGAQPSLPTRAEVEALLHVPR
jgi:ribokinase